MTYPDFLFTKPDDADTGPEVVDDTRRNVQALLDQAVLGLGVGWDLTVSGGTGFFPQFITIKSAGDERWVRLELTWGVSGGEAANIVGIDVDVSFDSGGVWEDAEELVASYDSFGNLTATTGLGGLICFLFPMIARFYNAGLDLLAHTSDTSAHGIGTLAAQDEDDVAITGGSVTTTLSRNYVNDLGNKNAAFNIDLSLGHVILFTVTGASAAASFTNAPANGIAHPFSIRVVNGGVVTGSLMSNLFPGIPVPTGTPTLQASGTDWVHGIAIGTSGSPIIEITGVSPDLS